MNRVRVVSFATVIAALAAALTAGTAKAAPPVAMAQSVAAQEHNHDRGGRGEGHARPAPAHASPSPRARPQGAPQRAAAPPDSRRFAGDRGHAYNDRSYDHGDRGYNRVAPRGYEDRGYRGGASPDRVYPDRGYRGYGGYRGDRHDVDVRHHVYGDHDYDRFFHDRYAYRPYWRSYGYAYLPPPLAIYPSLGFLNDGVLVGSYWQYGHQVYLYAVIRFGVREQIEVRDDGVILSEEPLPAYGW